MTRSTSVRPNWRTAYQTCDSDQTTIVRSKVEISTADWDTGRPKWTRPVGVKAGRVIKLGGKLPIKLEVGAYYNALWPTGGGTWQPLTAAALVF